MWKAKNIDNKTLLKLSKLKKSNLKIAKYFGLSEWSIRLRLKALGIQKEKAQSGRPRKVGQKIQRFMCNNYNRCNIMSLQDSVNFVRKTCNLNVSKQTIQRSIKSARLNCRVRQKKAANERNST